MARTMAAKIWDDHVVAAREGEPDLLYVDLHLVHEVTSPQAFEGLRLNNRRVRRPDLTIATMDHDVPTIGGRAAADGLGGRQMSALEGDCRREGIRRCGIGRARPRVAHTTGPQRGPPAPGVAV